ncbi:hypothetical protein AQI96_37680 [Streptomyces canus]|nr:hypothetical protein AQI96_37680 [Streptomyces canus]
MPRGSTYALLQTLVECGWVRTDATGFLYSVGIRALLTGTGYLDSDRYLRAVRPYFEEASDALGETVHRAQLDGSDAVHLPTRESQEHPRAINRLRRQAPAHAETLSKALLTERADNELPPGETIHRAQLDGSDAVHLPTPESHEHPRAINRLRRQAPAHAETLSKALLTERADDELPPGETIHRAQLDGSDAVHLPTPESHEHPRAINRLRRQAPAHT